jgi:hypothetical protein
MSNFKSKPMRKFSYIIFVLVLAVFFGGCNNDDWEAPIAEPSHHVTYTSEGNFGNRIQVGNDISFSDVSLGVVSRTWTLPESASFENGSSQLTSGESTIHAIFNEPGIFDVQLSQTFANDAYVGENLVGKTYDTTFTITVLDMIKAELSAQIINSDGTLGDMLTLADLAENEVTAGNSVRFFYSATGEPAEVIYQLEGAAQEELSYDAAQILDGTADETDVQYKKLETYSLTML